jgi:arsenate reductase
MKMYGVKNCDTIKKARSWLDDNGVAYTFHDYKKDGADEALVRSFIKQVGWEILVNKRGTTWRKLSKEQQESVNNENAAVKIMLQNPSIIKRPILDLGKKLIVGFDGKYKI